MSERFTASFKISVSVEFDDDGGNDVSDQAFDALAEKYRLTDADDVELIGRPEPATKEPTP